jgi:hypothetical protein
MQIYDVCTRRLYEKDGEKKMKWYRAGILKETDAGKRYIRLFHQPHTEFFVFNKEPIEPVNQEEQNQQGLTN